MNHVDYTNLLKHLKGTSEHVERVESKAKRLIKEGFDKNTLSPDEQQQLKEYIASLKEIKKSINELVRKGKKSPVNESESTYTIRNGRCYRRDDEGNEEERPMRECREQDYSDQDLTAGARFGSSKKRFYEGPKPPPPDKIYAHDPIEDLVKQIEDAGFILIAPKKREKTADYRFIDPTTLDIYASYTTGYVRKIVRSGYIRHYQLNKRAKTPDSHRGKGLQFRKDNPVGWPSLDDEKNIITSKPIPELEDRLKLILKYALKKKGTRR